MIGTYYTRKFNYDNGIYTTMSFNIGQFTTTVADAVGRDARLAQDLRLAFLDGAQRHADYMRRARCDANWQISAWRLKGLSATFGMSDLATLADEAALGVPGDPGILRRINATIASL